MIDLSSLSINYTLALNDSLEVILFIDWLKTNPGFVDEILVKNLKN